MVHSYTASLVAGLALALIAAPADAQFVTVYSPVVAPAVVMPAPVVTTVARPVYAAPAVAPAPVVVSVARPVVAPAPVPVPVAYTVARPVVATTTVAPVPVVTTRYRPLLGGSVTRVRYFYRPVTVYGY
ncbi:MAG: hypothetical protein AAGJ46_08665 [Planctomycetota bacterium]